MDSDNDLAGDTAELVVGAVLGTGAVVADAFEGADELIQGARRAGPRRLLALLVVLVVGAALFARWKSQQDESGDDVITA